MPRYRNDGSMPLNYGDRGPFVEPGQEFSTEDYPDLDLAMVASHVRSGFIRDVGAAIFDEIHEHKDRVLIDAQEIASGKRRKKPDE